MCDKVHCDGMRCADCGEYQAEPALGELPQLVVLSDSVVGFAESEEGRLSDEKRR